MPVKRLGKGLDSLLSEVALEDPAGQQVIALDLSRVQPNPEQPRQDFDPQALTELADSIRQVGVIQPIIVQDQGGGNYQIVAGERRYRASLQAGQATIPAIVRHYDQERKLEVALIENLQRSDLNPMEEALAYRGLMERFNLGQEEVAQKIGKNRSTVANSLRLLRLPTRVQEAIRKGELSAGHARTVLSVPETQTEVFFDAIQANGLSVRDAEALAKAVANGQSIAAALAKTGRTATATKPGSAKVDGHTSAGERRAIELWEMEEKLIVALGTKVQVKGDTKAGKIEIQYYSLEDLERIYQLLSR